MSEHQQPRHSGKALPESDGDLTYRKTMKKHNIAANGYYDSVEQAECVVGIVCVRNGMGAFLLGKTKLIGG